MVHTYSVVTLSYKHCITHIIHPPRSFNAIFWTSTVCYVMWALLQANDQLSCFPTSPGAGLEGRICAGLRQFFRLHHLVFFGKKRPEVDRLEPPDGQLCPFCACGMMLCRECWDPHSWCFASNNHLGFDQKPKLSWHVTAFSQFQPKWSTFNQSSIQHISLQPHSSCFVLYLFWWLLWLNSWPQTVALAIPSANLLARPQRVALRHGRGPSSPTDRLIFW